MREPMSFGVMYQMLSKTITAGRLNKSRTLFLEKHDVTNEVLGAVAEMTLREHDGAAVYTFPGKLKITVEVEELNGETND